MSNVVSLFGDTQKYDEKPVVVLADDDPSIRLMVRHVLESEEFDIVEASDTYVVLGFSIWYANQGYGKITTMPAFDEAAMEKAVQVI